MARPPEIKLSSSSLGSLGSFGVLGLLDGLGALVDILGLSYSGPFVVFGRGAFEEDLATDVVHVVVELGLAVVTGALVDEAVVVQEVEEETFLEDEEVIGALVLEAGGAR